MQRTYVDQFGRIITEQLSISEIMAQIAVVAYILVALAAIALLFQILIRCNKMTPKELYDATNMNIVSCWVVSILYHLNPIVLLVKGIYYITHIGRK